MNNQNKTIYAVVAIIVIALIGFLIFNSRSADIVENDQTSNTETVNMEDSEMEAQDGMDPVNDNSMPEATAPTAPAAEQGRYSGEEGLVMAPDIQVFEITYNGSSYSPANLTIKKHDIVIFTNNSNSNFWPASSPHPQHTDYPEFDAKKAIAAGGKYEFSFTKAGAWKYHDHINPSAGGTITVQ